MIWLFYLVCFLNGIIMSTLDARPTNSWQWWVSAFLFAGAHMTGYYIGNKHKEENKNA